MCVIERMKKAVSLLLAMVLLLQYIPAPAFAEEAPETGLCEHHAVHENCGYVAVIAGVDCNHEHDDSCFTTKCAHVHGDCGYVAAVEGEEPKEEIPCGHSCAGEEVCNEKVLNCAHAHGESCGYAEAVEGKACEFVCETCAAEEAAAAAVAEVKSLIDALPEVEAVQAMALEDQKAAYEQTQVAYEAYGKLTEEQKQLLPAQTEVFDSLFAYFNTLVEEAEGEDPSEPSEPLEEDVSGAIEGGNLSWKLTADGTLTISGEGGMKNFDNYYENRPWHDYVSFITKVEIEEGVTSIGSSAFTSCFNLKTVSIPNSVQDIGRNAFRGCSVLENVTIPSGVTRIASSTFSGCSAMTEVNLPDTVIAIDYDAFRSCSALIGIDFPESLQMIGDSAFYDCTGLETLEFPQGLQSIGSLAFSCFWGNKKLEKIEIPDSVTSIGSSAFSECNAVTNVKLSSSLTEIKSSTFYNCKALASITIPASVRTIWGSAFYGCNGLKEIIFGGRAPGIYSNAFSGVKANAYHPQNYASWTDEKRANYGGNLTWNTYDNGMTEEELDAVTIIASGVCGDSMGWALYGNGRMVITGTGNMTAFTSAEAAPWTEHVDEVTVIEVAPGVENLSAYAFSGMDNLKTVSLPSTLEALPEAVFQDCTALTEVNIPENVETIGENAFADCTALETVRFKGDAPVSMADTAFQGVTAAVYVPDDNNTWTDEKQSDFGGSLSWDVASEEDIIKGTCGANLTWTLSKKAGVLTISGTGPMEDYDWNNQPVWGQWENIRLVTSIVVQSGVTSIGSNAFNNMYNVTSITLPEGITTIGKAAFSGCSSLTELVLPSSVTTIGEDTINYLPGLTTIHIPENVVSIHERNFYGCSSLTSITVAANNPSYSSVNGVLYDKAAETLIYCPDGYADTLILPASVKTIDFGMFNSCTLLKKIEVDQDNADYSSIDGVVYDKGGKHLVYCPRGYEDVLNLPAKVDFIDTYGLIAAVKLKSINVDPQNAAFSSHNGVLYNKSGTELVCCPRGFTGVLQVADNTVSVAANAIEDCHGITAVYFPQSINSIGKLGVSYSIGLSRIVFTGAAPSLSENCFSNLKASVYYPAGDSSWTAVIGKDYGGQITWVPLSDMGVCGDNLAWTYEISSGTLTITGSGDMYDYNPGNTPWRNYYISNVIFSGDITSIGNYAFSGCKDLIQVSIPNTVKRMGTAFFNCPDLRRIDIPDSVTEISGLPTEQCYRLETIWVNANNTSYCNDSRGVLLNKDQTVLIQAPTGITGAYTVPDTVTKIGYRAFSGSYQMTRITLPLALTEIGMQAFSGCNGLRSVVIPPMVTKIGDGAFRDCNYLRELVFTGSVPNLSPYIFYGMQELTAYYPANRPEWTADVLQRYGGDVTWKSIGTSGVHNDAFNWTFNESNGALTISGEGILMPNSDSLWLYYRQEITEVVVESGTTVLGENVFVDFPNLQKVTLPDTVTTISYNAFSNCNSLQAVNIPDSVQVIKEEAFRNCSSLTEVTLPESVTEIAYATFADCSSLTEVNIPDSVTTIAYNAFDSCSNLTEVNLPANVTEISYSAFADCTSLQQITIPQNVTKVAYGAFSDCTSLETVTLPKDLSSLSEGAFKNCDNLTTVIFPENMTAVGTQALKASPNVTTIRFTGDAPAFDSNAFQGVTATAYYPADKAGWTSDVLQNYGGNITWIAVNNGSGDSGSGNTPVAPPASGGTDTGAGGTTTGNTTRPTTPVRPTVPTDTVTDVIVIEKTDMDAAIDAAGNAGHTEVEISAEDKGDGKTVSLPVESLEEITDADLSLSVVTKDATITFDTEALDAIVQQAGGKEIQLQYQEIKEAKLNNQQKKAIKDQLSDHKGQKHVLTFTVELTGDGEKIHDFRGGTATIRIPFELPKGTKAEDYAVFYLNSNGEIERYETTYDGKYLIVQLKHFSEYAVVYEPDVAETEPTEAVHEIAAAEVSAVAAASETAEAQAPSGVQIPIWLILMVVALLCVIALIFILRKRF